MSKRIIISHIFNDIYKIETISNMIDKNHIHNIVKCILSKKLKKKNLSLNEYVNKYENIKLFRNCNNLLLLILIIK